MAATDNVDLVLVIDTSDSMQPCIEQLKRHLTELVKPMQGYVKNIRFGLVGLSVSRNANSTYNRLTTLAGDGESWDWLYDNPLQYEFLSTDTSKVIDRLKSLKVTGDENNLLALDMAIDHPFGPISTTRRVIALFSDEPLESGVYKTRDSAYIPKLVEKLHARRIKLFCAIPYSDWAQQLSEANGSEIEDVGGGQGLAMVDFKALLGQMGKSISVSKLQTSIDENYQPALFGQNQWGSGSGQSKWNDQDET